MTRSRLARLFCKSVILTGALVVLFSTTVSAAPAPKSYRTLIVGVWELTKSDDGVLPPTTLEFTRDGKVKISVKAGDTALNIEGTYKLDGDKITITVKLPDEDIESTDSATISKLTEKELITKDQKGKIDEFKKKK